MSSALRRAHAFRLVIATTGCLVVIASSAGALEGRINAVITQGSDTTPLLYTIGANFLRIEVTGGNALNSIDIVDLRSSALTLLFPHNHSFVRLKPANESRQDGTTQLPWAPAIPTPPPGVGPQSQPNKIPPMPSMPPGAPPVPAPLGGLPPGIGPQSQSVTTPNIPSMPAMPPMPIPPTEKIELKPTGKKEKVLGYVCEQYEIKQRGETMEIWATDKLLPFQPYVRNQPSRFGPRMIEEQWSELLTAKKLFPLRATLRFDMAAMSSSRSAGKRDEGAAATEPEHFRFEVKSITPGKIDDKDGKLFQSPADYTEIQPLPF